MMKWDIQPLGMWLFYAHRNNLISADKQSTAASSYSTSGSCIFSAASGFRGTAIIFYQTKTRGRLGKKIERSTREI
jgi:hypothetical protein